jgi:hypothetical protein
MYGELLMLLNLPDIMLFSADVNIKVRNYRRINKQKKGSSLSAATVKEDEKS